MPNNSEWIESIEDSVLGDDSEDSPIFTKISEYLEGDIGSRRLTAGEITTIANELILIATTSPSEGSGDQDEN